MAFDAVTYNKYVRALMAQGMTEAQASQAIYAYLQKPEPDPTTLGYQESMGNPAITALAVDNLIGGSSVGSTAAASGLYPSLAGESLVASTPSFAVPEFSLGAEGVSGFNLAGEVPAGLTAEGGFTGVNAGGTAAAGHSAVPGLIGAYLAYDVLSNKKHGGQGAVEGGLAGAGIGWTLGGPVGAVIGAPIGAGIGYFGNFGDEDKYLTEYNRAQALRDQGINWAFNTVAPTSGTSKQELIDRATQNIASGKYGNPEFERTRDERLLRPEDIMGNAVFGEKFGKDWLEKFNDSQRMQIAQAALNRGLVREHHGTIDVGFDSDFDAQVQRILAGEETVETKPFQPGEGQAQYPREGGPTTIVVNMGGGGAPQRSANADMTTQAMINMGLSNDDAVNLISRYKNLGALTPNEAAEAAYTVGKMRGSM